MFMIQSHNGGPTLHCRTESWYNRTMTKRTNASILQDYEKVKSACENPSSIKEALGKLNLRPYSGNYKALRKACEGYGVSLPEFDRSGQVVRRRHPASQVFIENSTYLNGTALKKRLVNDYDWDYRCMGSLCPSPEPYWAGNPIILHLDHINGIHNDNRLENLRFLCPNCHTQTETYSGRNIPLRMSPNKHPQFTGTYKSQRNSTCVGCGINVLKDSARCGPCSKQIRRKIDWPKLETLLSLVEVHGYSGTGRLLGVSDNAIRKHISRLH